MASLPSSERYSPSCSMPARVMASRRRYSASPRTRARGNRRAREGSGPRAALSHSCGDTAAKARGHIRQGRAGERSGARLHRRRRHPHHERRQQRHYQPPLHLPFRPASDPSHDRAHHRPSICPGEHTAIHPLQSEAPVVCGQRTGRDNHTTRSSSENHDGHPASRSQNIPRGERPTPRRKRRRSAEIQHQVARGHCGRGSDRLHEPLSAGAQRDRRKLAGTCGRLYPNVSGGRQNAPPHLEGRHLQVLLLGTRPPYGRHGRHADGQVRPTSRAGRLAP
jgi:hypothetical protein